MKTPTLWSMTYRLRPPYPAPDLQSPERKSVRITPEEVVVALHHHAAPVITVWGRQILADGRVSEKRRLSVLIDLDQAPIWLEALVGEAQRGFHAESLRWGGRD